MADDSYTICYVIPFLNEEERIDDNYFEKLFSLRQDFLLVDDGSSDNTPEILASYSTIFDNVTFLRLPHNLGKSEAIRRGSQLALQNFEYSGIGFLDADAAISIEDVFEISSFFSENLLNYDAVWKSRVFLSGRIISRSLFRHYLSRLLASILGWVCPVLPYDTQCGLKVFTVSRELHAALSQSFATKWFIDLEIYIRLFSRGVPPRIWEIPCRDWREVPGSKISLISYPSISREIFTIIRELRLTKSVVNEI